MSLQKENLSLQSWVLKGTLGLPGTQVETHWLISSHCKMFIKCVQHVVFQEDIRRGDVTTYKNAKSNQLPADSVLS